MTDEDRAVRLKTLAREIRDDLGEHNVLDALALELAADRLALAEMVQEMAVLKRELGAIKLVQKARDILLPQAQTQYAGRRKVIVEAGMPMPAEHGFYALERDGVGNPFRWTGPTPEFHFDFHLDRSVPLRFVLQMPLWGAEHASSLRAMCDEMTVPLLRRPGNRVMDFEGMLLPRESLGVTRLTFIADHVSTVAAETDENAPRQLGVPFLRLTVAEVSEADFAQWLKAIEPDPTGAVSANKARPVGAAPAARPATGAQ